MNDSRTIRRWHRLAGLLLALPLAVWMVTGLLFHVKHRYAEAYEPLGLRPPTGGLARATLSPSEILGRGLLDAAGPVSLAVHPSGAPAYYGLKDGKPSGWSAVDGSPISAATEETGKRWAETAVAASAHRSRYGNPVRTEPGEHASALTGGADPALVVHYDGGKRVTVDLLTGEISQTGDLNAFIDLTYRLHYLQWTPWQPVNVAFVLVAMPLVLGLAASGIRLAIRG